MSRPDPRGRAMLRAYRGAKAPPGERRDALWSRLEASLDQGALGPSIEPEPRLAPAPARGSRWMVPAGAAVVAVAALVVAALTLGPGASRDATPRKEPSQAPHEVSPSEPAVAVPLASPATTPGTETSKPSPRSTSAPDLAPSPVSPRRRPARTSDPDALSPASEPPPSATPEVDELRAEMALIRTARQALQADRPARALEVLDAHARAFPAGQMREDRQVLRIEALCAAGKAPQARAEGALFLRAFPRSAHAQRVRATCAEP